MTIPPSKNDAVVIPPALIEAFQAAQHVAVLTGAGISAETDLRFQPCFPPPATPKLPLGDNISTTPIF